jgi:hypothetical protein
MKTYLILEFNEHPNLAIELGQMWWTAPNDIHIQFPDPDGFGNKYGANYWPTYKKGCYWAPDPEQPELEAKLEGFTVQSGLQGDKLASPAYKASLENYWKSPNK